MIGSSIKLCPYDVCSICGAFDVRLKQVYDVLRLKCVIVKARGYGDCKADLKMMMLRLL